MNIITSQNATPSVRVNEATVKPAAPENSETPAEPKESFSLGRTVAGGILGFMGRRIPSTLPEITPEKMEELKAKIKPGDVLMSADLSYPGWGRMEYWAIGSHYTHAALAGSDGNVYEAVGEGVIQTTVEEFLEGRKKIAIARPGLDQKQAERATEYAKSHLGKPYDGVFNYESNNEFYCSELVAKACSAADPKFMPPMGKIFGKEAVSPDVWRKTPGIEVVHDEGSNYWTNKLHYWPIAAGTALTATAGYAAAGVTGAMIGAGAGFVGSILLGNKIQTGHWSPSVIEIRQGKH